jgi:hypothetical protein
VPPVQEETPLLTDFVAQLERANRALREANVRLARERLGVHDSAAAAVEERRAQLAARIEQLEAELETEKQVALRNHELMQIAENALRAPRYRAVDKVRDLIFSVPGVRTALESRRRRLAASGDWLGSAGDGEDAGTPR